MRFIRKDNGNLLQAIACEMINFETNRKIFVNSVLNPSASVDKSTDVEINTQIIVDGVKVLIKPVFGIIYMDMREVSDYERWVKLLAKRIESLDQQHQEIISRYTPAYVQVETGDAGFTSMKIKIPTAGTKMLRETATSSENLHRIIYACNSATLPTMYERIGVAKFTWLIYPIDRLLHGIVKSISEPDIEKGLLSYFTLVYDPKYLISNKQDPTSNTIVRDLTAMDIKYINKILPIFSVGELLIEHLVKNYKPENDMSSTPAPSVENDSIQSLASTLRRIPINVIRHPSFIPGIILNWKCHLAYCPKRFGAIELIRQLGTILINPNQYSWYDHFEIPIFPLAKQVHDIQYKDVAISNTTKNDSCNKCSTPLYDDIYVTYETADSPTCKAYCPVCMHSHYDASDLYISDPTNAQYNTLYDTSEILAKTTYPKSYNQIIDLVRHDQIKAILRAMYSKRNTLVEKYQSKTFVMLNVDESLLIDKALDETVYIGFTNLDDYLAFYQTNDGFSPSSYAFNTAGEYLFPKTTLFPITFVRS